MADQPSHTCLGDCGRVITYRFALCSKCELVYGRSPLVWPAWLRFLWNDIQKERRRNQRVRRHEIMMSDFFEYPETPTDENDGIWRNL